MADVISVYDIAFRTRIGVPDAERADTQDLAVSIELICDTKHVGRSDDIAKGIDYEQVVNDVLGLAGKERKTIEALAEDIASMVLEKYEPLGVKVTVKKKPLPTVDSVSVTIERP